ncbi:MAG: hypothetical protein WD071_15895 [Pseudohongiella sp.]|uniref:hypothetical protein n=1 Tax=Pseudohongiella sp. TaxID=1979412 RepID=UPI00349FEBBF
MIAESVRPKTAPGKRARGKARFPVTTGCEWHGHFLSLLPSIRSHAAVRFRHLLPELREELVQETIARAFVDYAELVERGKQHRAFATPLSRFAVSQVRRGRRVGSRMNRRDALSDTRPERTRWSLESLESKEVPGACLESLAENRRSDPADIAASRIDIAHWLGTLTKRNRRIAESLASGERTSCVAKMFAVTAGRVAQLRREFETSWVAFQWQAYER